MMGLELRIIMTAYNSYKIQQQSNSNSGHDMFTVNSD